MIHFVGLNPKIKKIYVGKPAYGLFIYNKDRTEYCYDKLNAQFITLRDCGHVESPMAVKTCGGDIIFLNQDCKYCK